MSRAFVAEDHFVEDLPDWPVSEHPSHVTPRGLQSIEAANPENESVAADDAIAELPASQAHSVRETRRLYRLTAGRFVAVVPADTENEARRLAASHDAFGTDWGNPEFALCEFEDRTEAHVFSDISFIAKPAPPTARQKKRPSQGTG